MPFICNKQDGGTVSGKPELRRGKYHRCPCHRAVSYSASGSWRLLVHFHCWWHRTRVTPLPSSPRFRSCADKKQLQQGGALAVLSDLVLISVPWNRHSTKHAQNHKRFPESCSRFSLEDCKGRTTTNVAPLGAYYRAFQHREATERNSNKQTHRLPRSRAGALVFLTGQTREKRNRNKISLHKLHCFLSYVYCKCTSSIACFHMQHEAPVDFRSLLKLKNRNQEHEATTISIKFVSTCASRSEQFFILAIPVIPSLQ